MIIENVLKSVELQGIYTETDINDIGVNISLIDGCFLPLCFITSEDNEYLSVVATDTNGTEKINIISKESIVKIAIVYTDDLIFDDIEEDEDKMII